MKFKIILIYLAVLSLLISDDIGKFSITRVQYGGGGDWYCDQSSIPNLLTFINNNTNVPIDLIEKKSKIGEDIFIKSQIFIFNRTWQY
jgi:hypothetical protein